MVQDSELLQPSERHGGGLRQAGPSRQLHSLLFMSIKSCKILLNFHIYRISFLFDIIYSLTALVPNRVTECLVRLDFFYLFK